MRFIFILALIACSGTTSRQTFAFSDVTFALPAHWKAAGESGKASSTWVPEENKRGESIVLVRSSLSNGKDASSIRDLLERAQGTLTTDKVEAKDIHTANGMAGTRVDVSYVPPGKRTSYHRVHIVFIDGNDLVHVIYTARDSDPELTAVSTLLQSLHQV